MPHIGNFPERGFPSPVSVNPCAFMPRFDTYDFDLDAFRLGNRVVLTDQVFDAPVYFPHGARITKLRLTAYRDDALALLRIRLCAVNETTKHIMAELEADWTTGVDSMETTTITYDVVDNENWNYIVELTISPNDAVEDCNFKWAQIWWQG